MSTFFFCHNVFKSHLRQNASTGKKWLSLNVAYSGTSIEQGQQMQSTHADQVLCLFAPLNIFILIFLELAMDTSKCKKLGPSPF